MPNGVRRWLNGSWPSAEIAAKGDLLAAATACETEVVILEASFNETPFCSSPGSKTVANGRSDIATVSCGDYPESERKGWVGRRAPRKSSGKHEIKIFHIERTVAKARMSKKIFLENRGTK
jgi:hypothetical protein